MSPSSITIKIDYGPESVAGADTSVSSSSGAPTPFSPGGLSSPATGQSADVLPTPFANAAQNVGDVGLAAPAPSPSLAPAGSMESRNSMSLQDVPTPFSSGGFHAASAGGSAGAVPTPFDNPAHNIGLPGDQVPAPQPMAAGHADLKAPAPSQGDEGTARKGKTPRARRRP
jgi:hypothetical protein